MPSPDAVYAASVASDRTSVPAEPLVSSAKEQGGDYARKGDNFVTPTEHVQSPSTEHHLDHDGERELVDPAYLARIDAEEKADQTDPFLVDFSSNDPDNPKNWPERRKWFITVFTSLLCFTVAIGSSMPTGDLPGAAAYLHVSEEATNLSITLFVCGFGFGPMLFASLSEMIGRQPVYLICGFLYFIFNMQCALSENIATLLSGRMIAGLAASAPMTNVGGSLSDVWRPEQKGIPMAMFSSVIFVGPAVGPLVGGFIAVGTHSPKAWQYIYWTLFAFTGIVFIISLFASETLAPVILKKRARKLRKSTGDERYSTANERVQKESIGEIIQTSLLIPLLMLVTEPMLILFSAYLCLVYALLYLLFFALPIVFGEGHGFNAGEVGLTFLALVLGIVIANLYVLFVHEPWYKRQGMRRKNTPEDRLPLMMVGAVTLPISMFIMAWTSMPHVQWAGALISLIPMGFAFVSIYIAANSYIVDVYPRRAASALAAKTLARSLCGAAVPLFVNQMFHKMHNQWAFTLMAFVTLGMAPIPFIFFKIGPTMRARSKNASSDDE